MSIQHNCVETRVQAFLAEILIASFKFIRIWMSIGLLASLENIHCENTKISRGKSDADNSARMSSLEMTQPNSSRSMVKMTRARNQSSSQLFIARGEIAILFFRLFQQLQDINNFNESFSTQQFCKNIANNSDIRIKLLNYSPKTVARSRIALGMTIISLELIIWDFN